MCINGGFFKSKISTLFKKKMLKTHFIFWKFCILDYCKAENMPINTSACKDAHIWKTIPGPWCKDLTVGNFQYLKKENYSWSMENILSYS